MHRLALSVTAAACLVTTLAAVQDLRPRSGQSIFIVAARDSHLLTLCPSAIEVKTATGSYWEADRAVIVYDGPYGLQGVSLTETGTHLLLPAPGGRPAAPAGTSSTLGVELDGDRIAPDAAVKKWLEQEFVKQKFTLVDAADRADVVFVAEALWRPLVATTSDNAHSMQMIGDWEPNLLQGVIAFAVPAAAYWQHLGDLNALLAARIWEGSVFYHMPQRDHQEFSSASPQELVKAFQRNARPAKDHPPICAASNHPFSLEGVDPHGYLAQQGASAEREEPAAGTAGRATFRSNVTYVLVPVRVTEASGNVVANLTASDFTLREDGVEQKIDRLIPMAEPFHVAVLVDTSASMRLQVEDVQNAILTFIDTLRAEDRVMPVSFNDRITAQSDFLADHSRLRLAVFQVGKGEGTRLWDALDLVTTARLDRLSTATRKAIVLFTDGIDTRSRLVDAAGTMRRLAESQVPVYVVQFDTRGQYRPGLVDRPFRGEVQVEAAPRGAVDTTTYAMAGASLQALADTTGGRLIRAETLPTASDALREIARELNGQYTICYYPTNQAHDGAYRKIAVTIVRPDVTLRARAGYRAPSR
jgi:Ca-activated chloride channel family protein